jgi:hypothetical protein
MTPISEQIIQLLYERLELSGVAVGGVIRPTQTGGFQPKDYQIIITQGSKSPNDDLSYPGNPPAVAWDWPISIAAIVRQSEDDLTAIDTLKNQFCADVSKAITTGSQWWNWNNLAIDTKISDITDYQASDGSGSGCELTVTITYRVAEDDPYRALP